MQREPGSPRRDRRNDIMSLGIVAGFAWTILCLVIIGDSALAAGTVALLWVGGVGAIAGVTALILRPRAPRRKRHRAS